METTESIEIGQIVKSNAGRDKGRLFIVFDIIDGKYVMIVDGDLRRLDNPKKKKIKHLKIYNKVFEEIQSKIQENKKFNNAYVRKLLNSFKEN